MRTQKSKATVMILIIALIVGAALTTNASTYAQEEPSWPVLIEVFTADWSEAGLTMSKAVERLAAERGPEGIIPLEYHLDDEYHCPATRSRMAAQGVERVPVSFSGSGYANYGVRDEMAAYENHRLTLLSIAKNTRPPTLDVRVNQHTSGKQVALQAWVENKGEEQATGLQLLFVLYEDLGRDGYHFVVRAMSPPHLLDDIDPGGEASMVSELALPDGADPGHVQAVAIVQRVLDSEVFPLFVLAVSTTATSYSFPPPMPEEAAPAAGLPERPQVMDLRAILTRLRPWLTGAAALTALLLLLAAVARPHTFRYALRSLLGRADRTALLLVGVLAASLGVSLLSSVTEAAQVRVAGELAAYWRTTYDLLVRPTDSRSRIEDQHNLLEAHYESGLAGGITMAQYEAIKALPEVEVAAPLAILGYFNVSTAIETEPLSPGAYRVERTILVDNGLHTIPFRQRTYTLASPDVRGTVDLGFDGPSGMFLPGQNKVPLILPIGTSHSALLAAIEPQAEATLVGLDEAVLEGRYFLPEDELQGEETGYTYPDGRKAIGYTVPALVNSHPYISFTTQYTVSQITLPLPGVPTQETLDALREAGGRSYLDQSPAEVVWQHTLDSIAGHEAVLTQLQRGKFPVSLRLGFIVPSPIHYREVLAASVTADLVLEAMPLEQEGPEVTFRRLSYLLAGPREAFFELKTVGTFDLARLLEGQQLAPNAVPLETYLSPQAVLKYDETGQPTEPVPLRPTFNPGGYVTTPPLVLAPLELAELLGGPTPISCIRVRAAGIEEMNDEARAKIEALAQQIVDRTGLEVDVMVGSSPQPLLVHIPGYGDVPPTGYVEELWVKKNVDTAILQNTHWTSFLMLGLTLGVCALYIASISYLSVLGRQGELGLLKAVGWRTSEVVGLILAEQALVGGLAGVASALLALALTHLAGLAIPIEAALLVLPLGVGLCLVGGLAPAWRAVVLPPAHVVQAGEVRARGRALGRLTVVGYASRHLLRRRGRALAAVLLLALATAMLAFMGLVTLSARRFLQATLLGQHVALEVQGYHLAVALLCALVAALTVADLTLLNARERRREMGLLRAAGWRAGDVVRLFLVEAAWIGLLGGLLGSGLALGGFAALSPTWPEATLWVALGGLALPVLASAGAAWYPAWVAAGELPVSSLNELPRQRPAVVERRQAAVRLAAGLAVAALAIGGLVWWRMQVPPAPAVVVVAPPATPEPMAVPTPTATLGPPVEPAAVHPAEAAVESLRIYEVAQVLMEMGERKPGSEAAREAADYVAETLALYGLAVEREEVNIPPLASARHVALRVGKVEVIPQGTAAHLSALAGEVITASLVVVSAEALPSAGEVEGKIVVIEDRALPPPTVGGKDERLPGLAAVLETYPAEALAAAVSLTPEDAAIVRQAMATGEQAQLVFEGLRRYETVGTENIVATLPGMERPGEEVWLLATRNAEGWDPPNDGGSTNTALLLELARALAREPLPRTVRFISLGSERTTERWSSGTYLAQHRAELGQVVAAINVDTALGGETLLFGGRLSGRFDPAATPAAPSGGPVLMRRLILIDLDSPEQAAAQLARIRGEVPPPWGVETPTWLMRRGYALAVELDHEVGTTWYGHSEWVFLQSGVPAARIAWGVEEGLFSEEEMPLRVERLEQSAALAYALVGRLAEEGRGE